MDGRWVLTPGFLLSPVLEFIPRAIQPFNCLPHSYKTHEPPNDSKIGVEQPYRFNKTLGSGSVHQDISRIISTSLLIIIL